ncbi:MULTISPECIES: aminobenzoate oxygenase [Acidianus]|uniref:Aminobenzoate oxygenase n=1 Tax=Candidatus Acidianus copahuensis TaxID=1160895 RepID=A0A031LKQ6_9CREN|nr:MULTISPECIES: aminobenzoate oxygenase [Acidianus]EZQ01789.1 aminobenzoate oxygenase [Candidatus Acidianus copahuensis]NON61842.1 aminobenzoate oxygenase [Acidianus sp. RZ1]
MQKDELNFNMEPPYPENNVYPPTWNFDNEKAWQLYRRAKREQWDEESINWAKVKEWASGLDRKQRLAIAYWWSLLSNFDNATPVFAYAVIKSFEYHLDTAVRGILTTITFDENRHNMACGLSISNMLQGFPLNFTPKDDLERKAKLNAEWVWWNGSRYWKAYLEAYRKYTFDVLFTSFMMGEAAATTVFTTMSKGAKMEEFSKLFKNTAVDETRHYAFTHLIISQEAQKMSEEKKKLVTKQVRAGFVFLSLITYKPPKDFWKLPPWFIETHEKMENIARDAGFYIPTEEEKENAWRDAIMRVGSSLYRYGIEMPSIPELGISGEEIKDLKEEDFIPIF